MNQTPIQKAIAEIEKLDYLNRLSKKAVIEELKQLLPYEEEEFKKAVVFGNQQEAYDGTEEDLPNFYFNQTFKQND